MTLRIPMRWFGGRCHSPDDQRRGRLLRVLKSAVSQTRYAREYDPAVHRFESLPTIDLLEFLCHPERYAGSKPKPIRERLHYPLGAAPRTAVIARAVEESRRVRCFKSLQDGSLRPFAPQALAAPLDALRAGAGDPAPLRNAVIAFTGILEGPLTPEDADSLWRQYQVPVFEQFLGMDGELLAWECEIHHGLHVREEAAHFESMQDDRLLISFLANPRLPVLRLETGLTGRLVQDSCPCGEVSPRVVDLRRRTVKRPPATIPMSIAAVS